jgi:two-component system sensor histidine kinase CiaH
MNLFHSARLKLTTFYFATLLVFCLLLTFGVRGFTNYELRRGDDAQRGAVHTLIEHMYDPGPQQQPPGDRYFANAQQRQSNVTREDLNRDFFGIDLVLLIAGAFLSYWYAGRTLKPIEEAHEAQKRFTSDASHELRTPLASMRLENEVFLRQKGFKESEARDLIGSNLEEVARLERLATNLLALNQYEHSEVTKRQVAIADVVHDAVERSKRSTAAAGARFTVTVADADVMIERESITELITILLDNALKYGPKGGAVVVLGIAEENNYVLAVRDHGTGIAEEDLPHIFDRMYRGDKARSSKISGHGIGLSLARQITRVNGAKLTAANHPDGGAVFTLTLG